jgi:hypothetical protein
MGLHYIKNLKINSFFNLEYYLTNLGVHVIVIGPNDNI